MQSGSWGGFSATYTLMRKQRRIVGRGKQENGAGMQRKTEVKARVEREQERASQGEDGGLHPSPSGAVLFP